MKYPKRLIEVDLPIKRISAHARREKSIRHGHISTLHIWWARRPLAACRAVICASLWPDPADDLCPDIFRKVAREQMTRWAKNNLHLLSEDSRSRFVAISKDEQKLDDLLELRAALLDFIADFANWDNSTVPEYLKTSRLLTQAAHEALGGEPGSRPLVVDPFAGGGSIPLEALRVGADAFASDYNPIPVLLNKVVLEFIPKYGLRLAAEIRRWGKWIENKAKEDLKRFYPKTADDLTPIAYLWCRTICCEGPRCGTQIPLIRSLWLAKTGKNSMAMDLVPNKEKKHISVKLHEKAKRSEVKKGTVRRSSAVCPVCGYTTPASNVRNQLKIRRGGASDARLLAIRFNDPKTGRRGYRLPNEKDITAAEEAKRELEHRIRKHNSSLSLIPEEDLPYLRSIFNIKLLGVDNWGLLYTPRQALALAVFVEKLKMLDDIAAKEMEKELWLPVKTCLALVIDRLADFNSSLCVLNSTGGRGVVHTFGRQALGIVWDFMETNPFNDVGANWNAGLDAFDKNIELSSIIRDTGDVRLCSAIEHPLPDDSAGLFATDPPYYDAVPYADLSDFFYVWLKRTIGNNYRDLFTDVLSPKKDEIVQLAERNPKYQFKSRENYEGLMRRSMAEGRRILQPSGIGIVVFAHKTTTGWETQLQAMINAGWTITASWPIDTERPGRLRAQASAALASSIHLVCRPRENPDGSLRTDDIGDWRDVLAELPKRIHEWMPRLAEEGVVGADAIFACLGPALEIYSRYSSVEKASGEKVELKEYLEEVWAAVSREALNMIFEGADASGFEEDARLTAMWLWTLRTTVNGGNGVDENGAPTKSLPGYSLEYDAARKIAQGLGAHLENLSRLVEIKGNTAMLLSTAARTRYLFGKDAAESPRKKRKKKAHQQLKFDFMEEFSRLEEKSLPAGRAGGDWAGKFTCKAGSTVLDQLHQSMILFAAGRGEAMKRFLVEEGVGRNPLFWRLAQALSALYPAGTDEKRWVDGVLARKKGLGL